jgi:hypothetical protein
VHALAQFLAAAAQHRRAALEEVLEPRAGLLVEHVEDLVDLHGRAGGVGLDPATVVDLLRCVGAEVKVDVAVRYARQRCLLDQQPRPLAQGLVVGVVDPDRDLGAALLAHVDVLHGADRHAAGLDLVALHELAGVHELCGHAVAAVTCEKQDRDSDYGQEDQCET